MYQHSGGKMDQRFGFGFGFPFPFDLLSESQDPEGARRRLLALAAHNPSLLGGRPPVGFSMTASRASAMHVLPPVQRASSQPMVSQSFLPPPEEMLQDRDNLFPYILHGLLEDAEKSDQISVVSWSRDGKAFHLHNKGAFQQKYLQLYFKLNSMDDFHSTLFSWGFNENENGSYHHPCFIKDLPEFRVFLKKADNARDEMLHPSTIQSLEVSAKGRSGQQSTRNHPSTIQSLDVSAQQGRSIPPASKEQATSKPAPRKSSGARQETKEKTDQSDDPSERRSFLIRLRGVLQKAEDEGLGRIIRWKPHGKAFEVNDRQAFVSRFLAECMESGRYGAFQRVLLRWGFLRVKGGVDDGSYFHHLFVRDDPFLCHDLTPRQMRYAVVDRNSDSKIVESFSNKKRPVVTATDQGSVSKRVKQNMERAALQPSLPCFVVNEVRDKANVVGLMFPWKLHQMLDDAAKEPNEKETIVTWQPDGVSFMIRNQEVFISKLLPKYFKERTWSDFTSELSNWGFVCFASGAQKGAFIHRNMAHGKRTLCRQMRYKGKAVSDMFKKNHGAFIVRLHEALETLHEEGKESIACWEPDGKSFTVNDRTAFIDDVVSAYFDSMTYATFEQRVRGWGFGRSPMYYTEGKATYFHPAFVRGKIPNIVRTTTQMKAESIRERHSFLTMLRIMIDDSHRHGHQTAISWLSHGKGFMIHDRPYFSKHIMPLYFKARLFTSFRQALTNHGFAQMGGNGWDEGAYYHKLFLRNDRTLCQAFTQQQMKAAMPGWIPSSEEPNFYEQAKKESTEAREETHRHFNVFSKTTTFELWCL